MTYTPPSVSVTQILVAANQNLAGAQLLPCVIGPLYRVVTLKTLSSTIPGSLPVTYSYPYLDVGSTPDTTSVNVYVSGGQSQYLQYTMTSGNPIFVQGANSITVSSENFITSGIEPGDIVVVDNNGGTYVVQTVDTTVLTFTSNILYTIQQTGQNFTIYRSYATNQQLSAGSLTITTSSIQVTAVNDVNGKPFKTGSLVTSYRALRADKLGFYSVSNETQLLADMEVSSQNLLGYTLGNVMLPASGNTSTLAYITADSSLTSFNQALSDLSARQDTYLIVPLTTDPTIQGNVVTHVNTMSQPVNSYFRAAIINTTLPVTNTYSVTITS